MQNNWIDNDYLRDYLIFIFKNMCIAVKHLLLLHTAATTDYIMNAFISICHQCFILLVVENVSVLIEYAALMIYLNKGITEVCFCLNVFCALIKKMA